jgi:hypothetical protein
VRALTTVASLGRHSFSAVIEALIILAIVITLALGAALANGTGSPAGADSVFAAHSGASHGGGGGGGKPPRGSTATLLVTPDPVAAGGSVYSVTGSGYGAGAMVAVNLATPGCCLAFNVLADSTGHISFETTTNGAGTYTVKTYRYGTTTLLASKTFTVQ